MKKHYFGVLAAVIAVCLFGTGVFAQEAAPAAAPAEAPAAAPADEAAKLEDKLLPLMTMEQAFAAALQRRALLANFIVQERAKLEKATEEEKVELQKNIETASKQFTELTTYMDVIFGLGGRREYEYNRVNSTIYLKVGSVAETFGRAIQARDVRAAKIRELREAMEKEADAAKKEALQKELDGVFRQYALFVNALFRIYQIHPARNYQYVAGNQTLYLKTNDEEISKLKAEIEKKKAEGEAGK